MWSHELEQLFAFGMKQLGRFEIQLTLLLLRTVWQSSIIAISVSRCAIDLLFYKDEDQTLFKGFIQNLLVKCLLDYLNEAGSPNRLNEFPLPEDQTSYCKNLHKTYLCWEVYKMFARLF